MAGRPMCLPCFLAFTYLAVSLKVLPLLEKSIVQEGRQCEYSLSADHASQLITSRKQRNTGPSRRDYHVRRTQTV